MVICHTRPCKNTNIAAQWQRGYQYFIIWCHPPNKPVIWYYHYQLTYQECRSSIAISSDCTIYSNATTKHNNYSLLHLHGLQLAHFLTTETEFQILLLVGADHYSDTVRVHIIRGNVPTVVQPRLGYHLSGQVQPIPHSTVANVLMVASSSWNGFD